MAYLGRIRLGDYVPLGVVTKNQNTGVPTASTVSPTAKIWDNLTEKSSAKIPKKSQSNKVFAQDVLLDNTYAADKHYMVTYQYAISGTNYIAVDHFNSVAGNTAGTIISMENYQTAPAQNLVFLNNRGQIKYGKNPA